MRPMLLIALAAAVVLAAVASLLVGELGVSPGQAVAALAAPQPNLTALVLLDIRLPRTVLALLIGAILGLSGAVLQGLLRNPLAEPALLGVSPGASLGAVIAIYYGFAGAASLAAPVFGLVGALVTTGTAMALARRGGTLALILAGAAVSAIAAAGVELALNFAPNPYAAFEITTWLMGSLADRSWDHVKLAAPFILAGGVLLLLTARGLDALALGETQAESLGVDVRRIRLLALFGTALGVGAATAVAGVIGFVGLVAPHVVRPLVGHRPGAVLVPAALAGALIVTLADIATRSIHIGPELRLGVLISLIGAPFFLWLVVHVQRRSPS
jgi:iron complex transport system permease protein